MESTLLTTSLKDYKASIDELRASLLNLNKDSEEYKKTVEEITERQKSYDEALAIGKKNIDGAEGSYNALVRQMKVLKDEWRATNDEARRNELGTAINDINNQLKNFDASIGNHQRNVGDYEIATKSLRQELKDLTQQIAQGLASGLKTTDPEIQALTKRAGELKDAMADANAMINVAASDVGGFVQALDLAKTAMAGLSAAQGLARLFGEENGEMKELVKTMQQMQALQTTLNGLQQLQTSLVDRGSATYRLYNKVLSVFNRTKKTEATTTKEVTVAEKADATATDIDTTAKVKNTVATTAWNVSLKMVKATLVSLGIGAVLIVLGELLAHINDITKAIGKLVGWLGKVTGVTEVIKNVSGWISDNVDAFLKWTHITEEKTAADIALAEAEKAVKKATDEYYETLGKERTELDLNIDKLKNFKGSKDEEKKLISDLNSKYGDLLGTYKTKNEWIVALEKNGQKYIDYLMKEAQATAMAAEAGRLYVEWRKAVANGASGEEQMAAYGAWQKVSDGAKKISKEVSEIGFSMYGGDNANTKKAKKQRQTAKKQQQDLLKDLKDYTDETIKLINHRYKMEELNDKATKESELNRINDIYNIQSQYYDAAEARLNKALKNVKEGSEEWKKINDAILSNDKARADAELKYEEDVAAAKKKIREDEKKEAEKIAKEKLKQTRKSYESDIQALDKEQTSELNKLSVPENGDIKATEAYQQKVFDIEKEFTLKRIALLESLRKELENEPEAYETLTQQITGLYDNLNELERKRNEDSKKNDEEWKNVKLQNYLSLADGIGSLMSTITDYYKQEIDQQVKDGKITEKEAKKRFEQIKKAEIATAIINTIAGAIGAYTNDAKTIKPAALGIAMGIVHAATVTAAGMAQVAKIKSTQYGSNGSGSSSGGIMSARVAPLIDTQDVVTMQTPNVNATNLQDQRVYVVESDITNVGRKVEVRESETTF